MAEDYELCTYEKHHKHKLILFLTSMRKYASELKNNDFNVKYFQLNKKNMKLSYEDKISEFIKGKKTGKWFFWGNKNFTEVNFQNNKVISHFKWENQNVVAVK